MGGLGPGIGGGEWLVIGVVALLVVGPERLPGLLRELGKWVAKARGMANEFRASFDDMARQSELDELRKEVEALRSGSPMRLGDEAEATFRDIRSEFDKPLFDPVAPNAASGPAGDPLAEPVMVPAPTEWPVDTGAVVDTGAPAVPKKTRARRAASSPSIPEAGAVAVKTKARSAKSPTRPRATRSKVVEP